jgi:2-polyprenyl-3-methyl-5-hydroxy-6-metoxy-1,4-benzoquinol methylase
MNETPANVNAREFSELQKAVQANRRTIHRLRERISILEQSLELVCGDIQMQWLYRNRSERMDPAVPIFPELRARFHVARYAFAAQHVEGREVADIACGTGYGSRILMEIGKARSVTGVDICPQAIEYAATRYAVSGARYIVADAIATKLPSQSLDCVVSFETLEHVSDAGALMDEFHRIMRQGGILICSTPNAWPLAIAPHHVREYDRASFTETLERHFVVEQLLNQNSGSEFRYNHGQPEGIVPTTDTNEHLAECFLAVARRR